MYETEFSRALAVFGTASDVGKSLLATAFCRLLSNAAVRVAPYKAQNMSNNSYVAHDGGEVGRAQYLQALACRIEPSVHHNPVLLKPTADDMSQVVLHGRAIARTTAAEYFRDNTALRVAAHGSLEKLQAEADVVVIEGAGSCAEVNLRAHEFVNFPAAHLARARVVLVADIDKGGVFAQVVGSLQVMPPEDRARVVGVVINKFRGDRRLFDDGVSYLERTTGVPVLGVIPYLYGLDLDAEDAVSADVKVDPPPHEDADCVRIGVIRLPHISNFTDFAPLARIDGVAVHYLYRARELHGYSAIVLPGSKSVLADLSWLHETGLARRLLEYHAAGGKILGVCGGFQMLGAELHDEQQVESGLSSAAGLGLIDAVTHYRQPKIVRRTRARTAGSGLPVSGYEIHTGSTEVRGHAPLLLVEPQRIEKSEALREASDSDTRGEPEGVRDDRNRVWATVLHGLFDSPQFCDEFLRWLEPEWRGHAGRARLSAIDAEIERFAQHVQAHMDWPRVMGWLGVGSLKARD